MKKRRHTPEQVIRKLAEGEKLLNQGEDLAEVCRQLEIKREMRMVGTVRWGRNDPRFKEILSGDVGFVR